MIYVIGDSHAGMMQGTNDFLYCGGGPITAYSLCDKNSVILETLQRNKVDKNDIILSIFGEIDARYRIFYQHYKHGHKINDIIDNIICRYLTYISSLRELYNIWVMTIVPTQRYGGHTQGDPSLEIKDRGLGGDDNDRKYITEYFNEKLKVESEILGIPVIDIYEHLVAEDGFNRPEIMFDTMHYNYVGDVVLNKIKEYKEIHGI